MKYFAIAGLTAVAAAVAPRDGWETVPSADPSTWLEYTTTTPVAETSTWVQWTTTTPVADASTWSELPEAPTSADSTWFEWAKTPVYTTTVVTAITTYCPEATKLTHAGKTWTITEATTLTITDCPCTISVPIYTKTSTSCAEDAASTWAAISAGSKSPSAPAPAAASTWAEAPYPLSGSSTPVAAASATTGVSWSAIKSAPVAAWTGAANKVNVGAGLAGVVGIAAMLL